MNARYFLRAIKYLLFVSILLSIIVLILFYTSEHSSNIMPWQLFEGKYSQLIIFIIAISAIYPIFGYQKKEIIIGNSPDLIDEITRVMKNYQYNEEKIDGNIVTYRHRSFVVKLFRQFEDRITITFKEDGFADIEGIRKDIVRISSALERELNQRGEGEI